MANFMAGFGAGVANSLAADFQDKKTRRRELVDAYAVKLQTKVLDAQTKRNSTKQAYTKAYKYAKANDIPFAVVNDAISRNGDVSKLMDEVASAGDNYRKAAGNPEYSKMRYGKENISDLFPVNSPEDSPEGLADRYTPKFGTAPVGETGGAFSTSGSQAFNAAIARLAKETGMAPEQVAGIIVGAYQEGEAPKVGAPQYSDAEAKLMGDEGKNKSFQFFYKLDNRGNIVDQKAFRKNDPELTPDLIDKLKNQGYLPLDITSPMIRQENKNLWKQGAESELDNSNVPTKPSLANPDAGANPTGIPLTDHTWKDPDAKAYWEQNYGRYKDDPEFTPENVEAAIEAEKRRRSRQQGQ